MKKIKSIYLVIISLILGLIISFIVTTNHYQNKIRKAEHIIELQKKSANFLQKIEDYSEELKKEEANKNFLKMKIQTELVELNVLTTNDHKDYFSNATKLIVRNYFDHEKLKLEHERIAKLLDYYENEFVPCRVKIINEDFLIHEIAQSEKLTQEEFESYKLDYTTPTNNKHNTYYLTKDVYDNSRMVIAINNRQKHLMAYFVFKDTKKAIKAYNKNIKGSACFDTSSRLYENGDLEVTESNCDEKSILRKHYKI